MDFSTIKKVFIPEGEVKQITRNGAVIWKGGYTNLVPTSQDNAGNIFNGTGYQDGYRLSSSGGLSAQDDTTTTGFILYTPGQVIRMAGVEWFPTVTGRNHYLAFYDANFAVLGSINCYISTANASGYAATSRGIVTHKTTNTVGNADNHPTKDANGVFTFDHFGFTNSSAVKYFRINGCGSGADMIVTLDEEI